MLTSRTTSTILARLSLQKRPISSSNLVALAAGERSKSAEDKARRRRELQQLRRLQGASEPLDSRGETVEVVDLNEGRQLLSNRSLAIGRKLEMMNVFLGFEQANKYAIYANSQTSPGLQPTEMTPIGFIAEFQGSLVSVLQRQLFRTHRPFEACVMSPSGSQLFRLKRPFQFINSRLSVYDAQDRLLGQCIQQWHPWRRQYILFINIADDQGSDDTAEPVLKQFAYIDAPLLSWDFRAKGQEQEELAFISKQLTGLAREIFTDTSVYSLEMSSDLLYAERAVSLAAAICIDFDYFSRLSGSGGGSFLRYLPFLIFWE